MELQKKDLIRELEAENKRCAMYMGFMYQVLQFTFVAIIALAVCAFGTEIEPSGTIIVFKLVLPICFYIFGVMYAFNAYALSKCGVREELIHSTIFGSNNNACQDAEESIFVSKDTYFLIAKNVATNRVVTLISYGVPLGFYLALPCASIYLGFLMGDPKIILPNFVFNILPIIGLIIYYVLMMVIIFNLVRPHFGINKIQKELEADINDNHIVATKIYD